MSRQSLVKAKGFHVATEFLCRDRVSWSGVVIEYFMSQQSLVKTEGFLVTT